MGVQRLCSCIVLLVCLSLSVGTRLYPCQADGYRDVEEKTIITFHCDQYTGGVAWQYKSPFSVSRSTIAVCTDRSCGSSSIWTVTYISAGNSSVTTTYTSRSFSGGQYLCDGQKCGLHIIAPAEVSQPTTNMTRQDSGYTLSVSADVTKVFSSRGLYSCIGQLGSSRQTTQPDLTPPASDVNIKTNRTGKCDATMPLPVTSGTYPCSVTVTPGNTQRSCGSITITRPPPPTISCPRDLIAENTPFTCTCNTSDMGQPGGRLRWYTGTGSDVNTEVISGNYDVSTLAMTWTVTRADNNVRKFRCVNNWTVNVTAQSDYTARVAYPPSTPIITGNVTDGQSRPALEGDAVTLACSLTSSGYPPAEVTWTSERPNVKDGVLRLEKVGKGDNQRTATCQASNAFTQHKGQQLTDTFTLDVYYGPYISVRPGEDNRCVMTSDDTACHVTEGQRVHLQCDVDSNPTPRNCTWRFLSSSDIVLDLGTDLDIVSANKTDGGVYQVQVETTKPDDTDDRLPLIARHNVTVLVKHKTTETKLLLNNKTTMTVNEKEAVTVTCQSRGQRTHRLVLLQRNVELAHQDDSSQSGLSGEVTGLSHDITARCDNTGIVTCRAYNGGGTVQHISEARLYVNCKPRRIMVVPTVPQIVFIDRPVSAAFYLEAFPLPDRFTFQYLGRSRGSNSSLPVPDSIGLRAGCTNTYADYAVRCEVSVDSVLDFAAQGFYTFTAANGFGEERLEFMAIMRLH